MSDDTSPEDDLFLRAAEEFSARLRRGERPSLDEYAERHPSIAARVRSLFPAMMEIERSAGRDVAADDVIPPPVEELGSVVGRYKLLERIGEGGFGVVYMAEQQHPVRRKVALKVIKPGLDTRQVIARFDAERQALALMEHESIARVLDAGTTETGRPFFVMELVRGVPITQYCDEHRLDPRQRLALFARVCRAVQHAHTKGVIHRDIKPTNVLVTKHDDGTPVPKVIDFGIAKATGSQLTELTLFTNFAQMIGTPLYMSPEQAELNATDVDTRSDVYSLGVLLYELLTGSTPFDRERLKRAAFDEVRRIIREEDPPRPSTRLGTSASLPSIAALRATEPRKLSGLLRGELDWIVMRALEKDRARRYETATGLAHDVERYLNDEPVQACPPSAWYRLRKTVRRNKVKVAVASLLGLALVTTLVTLAVSNTRVVRQRNEKAAALQDREVALGERGVALQAAQASERKAKFQEGLAQRRFYAAQMHLAMRAWDEGEPARSLELLEGQRPAADQPDLRGFEWYHQWHRIHGGLVRRLPHNAGTTFSVAYFPDGKRMASIAGGFLKVWDAQTGAELAALDVRGWGFAISPDGNTIGSWGKDTATQLWDVRSGKSLGTISGATSCTFAPDGKTVAVVRGADVEFRDVATREKRTGFRRKNAEANHPNDRNAPGTVACSNDGNLILVRVRDSLFRFYRRDGDRWRAGEEVRGHGWSLPAAFSPDGTEVAVAGDVLKFYSTDSQKEIPGRTFDYNGPIFDVAYAPDGKSIATAAADRTVRIWDPLTREQRAVFAHRGPVLTVAYSPDGKHVLSGGTNDALCVWSTSPPEPAPAFQASATTPGSVPRTHQTVLLSRDGKSVMTNYGGVRRWDVATGMQTGIATAAHGPAALSHDGRTVALAHDFDVDLWDTATWQSRGKLTGHRYFIRGVTFSPDDRELVSTSMDGTARVWDLTTLRQRLVVLVGGNPSGLDHAPDGKTFATATQRGIGTLWDAASGKPLLNFEAPDGEGLGSYAWWIGYSPDGETVALAATTGLIRIYGRADGQIRAELRGHTATVRGGAFSPDGETVASASDDATIRLWDAATGQEKATLRGHVGPVYSVAFSSDGQTLASVGQDAKVRLWLSCNEPQATAVRNPAGPERTPAATQPLTPDVRSTGLPVMPAVTPSP